MCKPEYERLMEQANQIKASGLEGDYRALAEFNNVVLAGHQTKFGMEFVTWEWVVQLLGLDKQRGRGYNVFSVFSLFPERSYLLWRQRDARTTRSEF